MDDPDSVKAYELVLGCSKGIRSLMADYAVKDVGVMHIGPLNAGAHDTISTQLPAIKSLCCKIPTEIRIGVLGAGERSPPGCAVFPVSADANVFLTIQAREIDVGKEAEKIRAKLAEARRDRNEVYTSMEELGKVLDKDVSEAIRLAESRRLDVEARLRVWEEAAAMLEM
jgi:valyl-tRNA synthetase